MTPAAKRNVTFVTNPRKATAPRTPQQVAEEIRRQQIRWANEDRARNRVNDPLFQ